MIVPEDIASLATLGVRIFSPQDGQSLGLVGMINQLISGCNTNLSLSPVELTDLLSGSSTTLARAITVLEAQTNTELAEFVRSVGANRVVPVLWITGTGGSGKSSITDEVVRRFRIDSQNKL